MLVIPKKHLDSFYIWKILFIRYVAHRMRGADIMAKLYLICGKICSGKSYYSEKLKEKVNAVILSPDEMTYDLINNEQGEFYNIFIQRAVNYLNKKAIEIVNAGTNVILERGLWSQKERQEVKEYFRQNGIETELHYVYVMDEVWKKQIEKRNKEVEEGKDVRACRI